MCAKEIRGYYERELGSRIGEKAQGREWDRLIKGGDRQGQQEKASDKKRENITKIQCYVKRR